LISICDIFTDYDSLFRIIFVFFPVYATTPYAQRVFFSFVPRYSNCLSPEIVTVEEGRVIMASNLCRSLLGRSPSKVPLKARKASWALNYEVAG
jgi:hypothetical protein